MRMMVCVCGVCVYVRYMMYVCVWICAVHDVYVVLVWLHVMVCVCVRVWE